MFCVKSLLILLVYAVVANCANILFITPIPLPTHHIFHKALALELVRKGHNVTMLTHVIEESKLPKNFTVLSMPGSYKLTENYTVDEFRSLSFIEVMKVWSQYMLKIVRSYHRTEEFQFLWNYPDTFKFDAIICDSSLGRFTYVFNERFHNPPTIALIPFLLPVSIITSFGAIPVSTYDPHVFSKYSDNMKFTDRFYNLLYTLYEIYYVYWFHQPKEDNYVVKNYPEIKSTLDELEKKVGLVLCNIDPVLDYPKILPPNIIPVGGLHLKPAEPLPKDLQAIMNNSENGVILFSLITNFKSDQLSPDLVRGILKSFSKLNQTVLWMFKSTVPKDVPSNVIVRKWFPQNDILGHLKTKLLINDGETLSNQQALYHGVPLIQIPFTTVQEINALKVVSKKIGIKLDLNVLSEKTMSKALNEVLNNKMYTINMKALSAKYRDRPQTALETAAYWVEYSIRHGSPDHLSVPTRKMSFFVMFHVDVVLGLLCYLSLSIALVVLISLYEKRKKRGKRVKNEKKKMADKKN